MTHSLVKYEYQPASYVQYRHYVECTCGFQGRVGTKEAAESLFDSHLLGKGQKVHFASLPPASKTEETWNPFDKADVEETKTEWTPFNK
jgi:6-phosphogluconolactonase/glucosamine-6-phosphate isomerase/deaminase